MPVEGTYARNAEKYGVGGLNIDGCRIATDEVLNGGSREIGTANGIYRPIANKDDGYQQHEAGRWPANVILDPVAGALLDEQTGDLGGGKARATRTPNGEDGTISVQHSRLKNQFTIGDSGGASRFFYCAKASRKERDAGLTGTPRVASVWNLDAAGRDPSKPTNCVGGAQARVERGLDPTVPRLNNHPTVKPLALTEYLARLILPNGNGRLLVPFSGSGSEMLGATLAGWEHVTGLELNPEYVEIARARLEQAQAPLLAAD